MLSSMNSMSGRKGELLASVDAAVATNLMPLSLLPAGIVDVVYTFTGTLEALGGMMAPLIFIGWPLAS